MLRSVVTFVGALVSLASATSTGDCSCGYQDPDTQQVWTEALVYYFNETTTIEPAVWSVQDFTHKTEKGWNSIYRQGARPENVNITEVTSIWPHVQALHLTTEPTTDQHLVNGGSIESVRQDMQYGSFRAAIMGAAEYTGGTAMTMRLKYNVSQSLEVDFMNMDDPTDAAVTNLVNGEWPEDNLMTNYTILEAAGEEPWAGFTNVRVDWTKETVDFYIGNNNTRAVTKHDRTLPVAGQALSLTSWSTGDSTYMEGPPKHNATNSYVYYVRAFFNTSTMSTADHDAFDKRCEAASFCSTSDESLRGASNYTVASTVKWSPPKTLQKIKKNAGIVAGCCSSFGVFALINVFFRRTPWHKLRPKGRRNSADSKTIRPIVQQMMGDEQPLPDSMSQTSNDGSEISLKKRMFHPGPSSSVSSFAAGIQTPLPAYRTGYNTPAPSYGGQTPRNGSQTPVPSYEYMPPMPSSGYATPPGVAYGHPSPSSSQHHLPLSSGAATPRVLGDDKEAAMLDKIEEVPRAESGIYDFKMPSDPFHDQHRIHTPHERAQNPFADEHAITPVFNEKAVPLTPVFSVSEKGKQPAVSVQPIDPKAEVINEKAAEPAKPAPTKRIDYLAGLVAVACLGVTLHHFCQTFWPYVTAGYGEGAHYPKAEKWLEIFVGSYLLTQLWIGPFFLTATRFLSTNYLKNGRLEDIAKKELRRAPRLFVPITIISLLEYFLITMGLTTMLERLPSVSWSTWPYVAAQKNFGVYMNNLVELAFLMPNAIPEIVTHYCIGVLWTVPVQLQFTYVVLISTVLIRDIKNPWKRFGFYGFAVICGWYAKSWSACHWCGLLLSDLEATYKWRVYLRARPIALYAVMTAAFCCAVLAPLAGAMNQHWSFDTYENGLHPDIPSGKPIAVVDPVYPGYEEPTVLILAFSIGLQILVELSTWFQAFLSLKPILWLHPHIMTIYLTHGFVMWTWGAWVCVALSVAGIPYWANLLITLVTTYAVIFLLAMVLSPMIEFPTQAVMRNLDRWTNSEPDKKRPTVAPYTKELVVDRKGAEDSEVAAP